MITTFRGSRSMLAHTVLVMACLSMIFPLVWMILLSLSDNPAGNATLSELLRSSFTLVNFTDALRSDRFGIYFLNSVVVASAVAIGSCLFSTTVAYAFARREFFGKRWLLMAIISIGLTALACLGEYLERHFSKRSSEVQ